MLVRDGNGQYESIDFRETAPAAAYEDMYKNYSIGSIQSGLASGVPGEIRGLEYLHHKYGVSCVMCSDLKHTNKTLRFFLGK